MLNLFGFTLARTQSLNDQAAMSYHRGVRDGRDQIQHESGQALRHVRDLAHNLPFHLNFELAEEVEFSHRVLSQAFRLTAGAKHIRLTYATSSKLRAKLTGKRPVVGGKPLEADDFDEAAQGNYERAAYIAKVIFSVNRPRYAKAPEWFDDVPAFLEHASETAKGAAGND